MKKLLILLLLLSLISCENKYVAFHKEKNEKINNINTLKTFSSKNIEEIKGIKLRNTPSINLLSDIIDKIDNAKSRIYIEVYILSEKRIQKALKNAKKRGVDVKIILEQNVYNAGSINKKSFDSLSNTGIKVVYSNQKNYSLNHSKMTIIDNEVIISTGNYSYSTFKYDRNFFVFINNKKYLNYFLELFKNDFSGIKKSIDNSNIILSPYSSRIKLETLFNESKKSIKMYSYNFSDDSLKKFLVEKNKKGLKVNMIFPSLKKVKSNQKIIDYFKKNNIALKIADKFETHAKAILFDDKYLYIGSINFSGYSIDKNREIGILIKDKNIIKKFLEIFLNDFNN